MEVVMEQLNQENNQNNGPEQHKKRGWIGPLGLLCIILVGLLYVVGKLGNPKLEEAQDVLSNRLFQMNDDSALYLYNDGTYLWYQNDAVKDDNYFSGTFEVYSADAAEDYLENDLSEYGITKEKLHDYYQRNSEDKFFEKENLCCLVMKCNLRYINGEEIDDGSTIPYFGFSDGKNYDLANMNTGNYLKIKNVELIEGQ